MIAEIYLDRFWVSIYVLNSGLFRHRFMWSSDCRDEKDLPTVDAVAIAEWTKEGN